MGYNASFHYPEAGGIGAFAAALADGVSSARTGAEVTAVHLGEGWVELDYGDRLGFERLVSTMPLDVLVTRWVDAPDSAREAGRRLRCAKVDYLDLGLRVTLNTDNRLVTATTVTDEYLLAADRFGLTVEELRWVMVNGFKSAFLPFRDKKMLLRKHTQRFDEIVAKRSGEQRDRPPMEWMGDPGAVGEGPPKTKKGRA